jgi:hypothetical protein
MQTHLTAFVAAGLLTLGGGTASAHHSFASEYDSNHSARLEGKVTRVEWGSPHSYLTIKARGEDGKEEHFRVELGSRHALEQKGWNRRMVKTGDDVTVTGWYSRRLHDHINAQAVRINTSGRELDAASSYYAPAAAN